MAKWYKNKGESMRVETGKVIISEPRMPGRDSELLTCSEKAFMNFKFGCFGCNKGNYLKREGLKKENDFGG